MSELPNGPSREELEWYARSGPHADAHDGKTFAGRVERLIFGNRALIISLSALLTVLFAWIAVKGLHIDASFTKQLPKQHEYMQTYLAPEVAEFRGANRVLIGLIARDGNMFQPRFFEALKQATDEVLVMDGIDRGRVQSLYTPNVRYLEVVEDGIEAGNVIPAEFQPTPEGLAQVRENILKAGIVGRLVANDFSGALVSAIVLEEDAQGRRIDPIRLASELETRVRQKLEGTGVGVQATGFGPGDADVTGPAAARGGAGSGDGDAGTAADGGPTLGNAADEAGVDVQIIGFAKAMGDIAEGALSVIVFAVITLVLTLLAVWLYCQSLRIALIPVMCSVIAVMWQLGVLVVLGYGIDPLGLLVPFLIFAIGVSHGVQKISAVKEAAFFGIGSMEAARRTFRQLLAPAVIALLADLVGFITILLIPVQVIREMAVTASIGVAIVILTDLVLLPVLVSFVGFDENYRARVNHRQALLATLWKRLACVTNRGPSLIIIALSVVLAVLGVWKGRETPIGDTQAGVPELRPNSRYNLDTDLITSKFSIGVDILTVIVQSKEPACVSYDLMTAIDRFGWRMQNVEGVQDVITLPFVAKTAIAGWNEGSLKWRNIPREQAQLTQSTRYIETSTGLLNAECNVVPVMLFLKDHRAETIERAVAAVKDWREHNPIPGAQFNLAAGNVGVMAATNEEVKAKEFPILAGVFLAVIAMCLITFRSVLGTVLVVLPLALVSVLVYAVMALVGIGLKLSTLPMVALGAGIGVDYGIYLFSRMQVCLKEGLSVHDAYERTLRVTGSSIIFTGITLAIGVATWVFSPLKFQADIGVMLTFMFLVNMLAAIVLLPALATWLVRTRAKEPDPTPPRDVKQLVMGLQKAALHLVTTIPRGTSFFRGAPSIAPDEWPEREGERLDFIAQIDLGQTQALLPMDWLPKSGALLFFYDVKNQPWGYDPEDRGSWAVIHQPVTSGELAPADFPNPSDPAYGRAYVMFRTILNYPSAERVPSLDLTDEEGEALTDLSDEQFGVQPRHQVGGLPSPIQADGMERMCQLVSHGLYCGTTKYLNDPRVPELERGAAVWRLLLQVDSDDSAGFEWGDAGRLYFFVRESEARAGDFSNVWVVLQCG